MPEQLGLITDGRTRVGHVKHDPIDVYVGRGSDWGNPFVARGRAEASQHPVTEVDDVLGAFEQYVRGAPELMSRLPELRGKVLGCYCVRLGAKSRSERCHAQVLARLVDQEGAGTRAARLAAFIRSRAFSRLSDESELQDALEALLRATGYGLEREVVLGVGDRVDFLVGGDIALEVKVDGTRSSVVRQLGRYASHDAVQALVLVTTRARHLVSLPPSLKRKPLVVASLLEGAAF